MNFLRVDPEFSNVQGLNFPSPSTVASTGGLFAAALTEAGARKQPLLHGDIPGDEPETECLECYKSDGRTREIFRITDTHPIHYSDLHAAILQPLTSHHEPKGDI